MRQLSKTVRIAATVGFLSATTATFAAPASASTKPSGTEPSARGAAAPAAVSSNFALGVGPAGARLLASGSGCQLGNGVQHVMYVGFDNFHLRRDNANTVANNGDDNHNTDTSIPSDLEQVPALYNFLKNNGTVLANHHTPLISHTSVDFTSAYSGVYGDRNGIATTQNNIAAYNGSPYTGGTTAAAQSVTSRSNGGFGLWTDPLNLGTDTTPQYLTTNASNAIVNGPAPWVPFTRAGCDVGAVAATTMVLENNNSLADINAVAPPGTTFAAADEGLAVHCAVASPICGLSATDAGVKQVPDNLPAEPGAPYNGSAGFDALYGHRFIAPAVNDRLNNATSGGSTTLALLRSPSTNAFPGFNGEDGNYSLGWTLAMQKAGIPVTFGYLTAAHNCYASLDGASTTGFTAAFDDYGAVGSGCNHTDAPSTTDSGTSSSFGAGEQGYVNYLAQLNTDFTTFFTQAAAAGLTTSNTEFVFYSDENDHAAEATPANPTCDGVTTACQYNHASAQTSPTTGQLGEVTVKLDNTFPQGGTTSYTSLSDSAPDFYVEKQGTSGPPSQTDTNVRSLERSMSAFTYTDPYTANSTNLARYIVDQAGMNAEHMITADPNRSPTFTIFAPGEDFVEYAGSFNTSDCGSASNVTCSNAGFPYVHGDFAPETTTTWAGFAGPGVANLGQDDTDWNDHVDLRPTALAVAGLQDDYTDEGRIMTEILTAGTVNSALTSPTAAQLGSMMKQIDAPNYGATETGNTGFGPALLQSDSEAVQSNAAGDSTYGDVVARINTVTNQRNVVVTDIQALLTGAASGTAIDSNRAATDIANGQCLLAYANQLKIYASNPTPANAPTDCNIGPAANVPEASHSALLVLSAGVVMAAGLFLGMRRRRHQAAGA